MRIIVLYISLTLVACTSFHFSHAKTINYRRVFDVKNCQRMVRSGSGGGSGGISGFYIPANRGASRGGGGDAGGNQGGGSANVFNTGPIGSGYAPVGNYGPPNSGAFNRLNNQAGGGGTSDSSFQGWIPIAGPVAPNLLGAIGVGASSGFGLSVVNAGEGSYGASSISTSKIQGSNFQSGIGSAANSGVPGPVEGGYTGGLNLIVNNAGSSSGAQTVSTLSNQDVNREAASGNKQGWSSNQVGIGENQASNGGNQVGNGGFVDGNFLGFASNQVGYFLKSDTSGGNIGNQGNNGGVGGGGFGLSVVNAGEGSYGASSISTSKIQGSNFQSGIGSASNSGLPGPVEGGYTGGLNLIVNNAGSSSGAQTVSTLSNQDGNREAASGNKQGWSSNQVGIGENQASNGGNQVGNGGFVDGNFLGFASNQVGYFLKSDTSGGNIGNQANNGGVGGGSFQSFSGGSAGAHNQAENLQNYYTYASNVGNQVGNAGAAAAYIQKWSSNQSGNKGFGGGKSLTFSGISDGASSQGGSFQSADVSSGNIANQDGNVVNQVVNGGFSGGNTQGADEGDRGDNIQGFIKGSDGNSNKSGRSIDELSAAESSFIDRNSGGYVEIPVGFQTSEGRYVEPELLDEIRTILYREEVNNQPRNYAPAFAYGAPGSGRVVGIVIEGIDQSIQIAQFHQSSSGLTGPVIDASTLAIIPSGNYGAPHK